MAGVRAVDEAARQLLGKRNAVGVGLGTKVVRGRRTDEPCIVVFVERKVPDSGLGPADVVPRVLGDMKTDVIQTGTIRALQARTARWRPAPGGVSIGHVRITAGTLGGVALRDGVRVILSNNHVLADSNRGVQGDPILQPGPYDGGRDADRIATLTSFVPIAFDPSFLRRVWCAILGLFGIRCPPTPPNYVDAAIATPLRDADLRDDILEVGTVRGTARADVGTRVKKSGRTTALTQGEVVATNLTVRVLYGTTTATFTDQLATSARSDGGDSGSLVVDEGNRAVGLLFAGGDDITILNPIAAVEQALRVRIPG
ncbi:MAG TPA: hypothetical protein VJ326_07480 [Thermoplasmata archaeon]|nr:hypothetical protein [Thermoplasmata archaeon]